jgi:hypothetical protein
MPAIRAYQKIYSLRAVIPQKLEFHRHARLENMFVIIVMFHIDYLYSNDVY